MLCNKCLLWGASLLHCSCLLVLSSCIWWRRAGLGRAGEGRGCVWDQDRSLAHLHRSSWFDVTERTLSVCVCSYNHACVVIVSSRGPFLIMTTLRWDLITLCLWGQSRTCLDTLWLIFIAEKFTVETWMLCFGFFFSATIIIAAEKPQRNANYSFLFHLKVFSDQ